MRRYIASLLLLTLAFLLLAAASSYSPLPVAVPPQGLGSGGMAPSGGASNLSSSPRSYFLVSPGPRVYLRLSAYDSLDLNCRWETSRSVSGGWTGFYSSESGGSTGVINLSVYYSYPSPLILAPLHVLNFSVPVQVNPYLDVYRAETPVKSYSLTYREFKRPSSGNYSAVKLLMFSYSYNIPGEVERLAHAIATNGSDYEKALAIESFLREYFNVGKSYVNSCGKLGDFLFRTRTGSPYDISSLFVMMARALGLPARMVEGYRLPASSEYRMVPSENVTYWAEVKFEKLGWVIFDPVPRNPRVKNFVPNGEEVRLSGVNGKVYYLDALAVEPTVSRSLLGLPWNSVAYLPVWNGSLSYARIAWGDPVIDVINLPDLVSPGETVSVRFVNLLGGRVDVSSKLEVKVEGDTLVLYTPEDPGVYWVRLSSGDGSVMFPVVVPGRVHVSVEGYPSRIRAGSNFTVFGRVLWKGKPVSRGTVEVVIGREKGEADYVIGRGNVSDGSYSVVASVPASLRPGSYWLVVRYVGFPYTGDSDPVVEVLPPLEIRLNATSDVVPAGLFNLTGFGPDGVPIDVLVDGRKVASVVPENGTFSVPLNLTPGEHEFKFVPKSGNLKAVERLLRAVKVDLDLKPYSSGGRDYLKLLGQVEGMEDGRLEIDTPYGRFPVTVKNGRFEFDLPAEFPRGGSGFDLLPIRVSADGAPLGGKTVVLSSGRLVPNVDTVIKTPDNKFLVSTPEGVEGDKLNLDIKAFDRSGKPISGELNLNLGDRKVKVDLKKGGGKLELPKTSFNFPDLNMPSVGGKAPSLNFNFPDVSGPDIHVSGFHASVGKEIAYILLVPLLALAVVAIARSGLSGPSWKTSPLDRLKTLGSPDIELERDVYLPGEPVRVILSREADLYVDGKFVGHGKAFSLKLPEGIHILRAGRREREVYVLRPKNAVMKLYEDYFLPFASSKGVRVEDATPKEIKAALLSLDVPEGPLTEVTRIFEFAKYGDVEISREDFEGFVESLRAMGVVK